ncbi:molybdenum cofactor guanylyltransferase [Umezawaea beigongshangensis]|uniref:molybdenum cofactor guanylyltransferase n=1 Tax=Umezawaea beigongshangensis TaxID=2780383 RepID=UPI0018F1D15A|nr:molybdenum cofactor guanylyltransferase [Umezawaea beigongshangensis]
MTGWSAVVLAGGSGTRLGGVDKAAIEIGGRTLLDRLVGVLDDAERIVVVGPERAVRGDVTWAREDPPGGGPLAGVAAGLAHVETRHVVLLAVDQPGTTSATITRLLDRIGVDGALLVDADGRAQWLTSAWRAKALRAALPADPAGRSLRSVLGALDAVLVPAEPGESDDVDTPADLARFT